MPNSTADADIFYANKLQLTDKPFMKTESQLYKKSSSKTSSTTDAEIFPLHVLLLAQKPLTKTRTLGHKKSSKQPSCTADADIFCGNKLILTYKPMMKNEPLCPKNHPRKPVLRLTLTSSAEINYCWQTNRWWKLSPCVPKIILENQFYGWRWNLQCT
jgi:uncharacterized protein (DUF1919 family)